MAKKNLDRFGIAASTLCAAHCVVGAVFAGAAGFLSFLADEKSELIFVALAALIAVIAVVNGFLQHRSKYPAALALFGLIVLASARLIEFEEETGEVILSVFGACMLIAAHLFNLHHLRRQAACHATPGQHKAHPEPNLPK